MKYNFKPAPGCYAVVALGVLLLFWMMVLAAYIGCRFAH